MSLLLFRTTTGGLSQRYALSLSRLSVVSKFATTKTTTTKSLSSLPLCCSTTTTSTTSTTISTDTRRRTMMMRYSTTRNNNQTKKITIHHHHHHHRMFTSTTSSSSSSSQITNQKQKQMNKEEEWKQRCQLAVSYRIAYLHDWHENIFNHITLKVTNSEYESNGPYFLINDFGLGFDEITASNLLKVNFNGDIVTDNENEDNDENDNDEKNDSEEDHHRHRRRVFLPGYVIHSAIHEGRPDVHAVWHGHAIDTTAVCQTKYGLLNISQESALAMTRGLSYHPFEGTANVINERPRIVQSLGPNNSILLLENHGPIVASPTLANAFAGMYFLTRACTYQIKALSSVGGDISQLHIPPTKTEDEMMIRVKKFNNAPQQGIQYNTDQLMFEYAVRTAERTFGADNIYQ